MVVIFAALQSWCPICRYAWAHIELSVGRGRGALVVEIVAYRSVLHYVFAPLNIFISHVVALAAGPRCDGLAWKKTPSLNHASLSRYVYIG
jgi:hypothetical protein